MGAALVAPIGTSALAGGVPEEPRASLGDVPDRRLHVTVAASAMNRERLSEVEILNLNPVLAVHDLARSAAWYRDVLGCKTRDPDPGNWTFCRLGAIEFMLGRCPDAMPASDLGDHSYVAYLRVDDVQAFHNRAVEAGAEITNPLTDEPWGMRVRRAISRRASVHVGTEHSRLNSTGFPMLRRGDCHRTPGKGHSPLRRPSTCNREPTPIARSGAGPALIPSARWIGVPRLLTE